ncbi:class I SAM-dependent methyltransferase [Zwartia sp.]|uniref:class I SAM-dependent methyltransferase n=1 Tax=Zwartia sp. TaxID=2978004 RepID=UPI003BAF68C4
MNSVAIKILRRLGVLDITASLLRGRVSISGRLKADTYPNINALIDEHFTKYSTPDHPCKATLTLALELLNEQPALIAETGSSAWGTNSTLLLDSYCNSFGGSCYSVDIRLEPMLQLQYITSNRTRMYCDDSVTFLKNLALPSDSAKIDLLYLDSWDVNWADPMPSAIHGLNEFLAAMPKLKPGSLVLIDDTPRDLANATKAHPGVARDFQAFFDRFGFAPGKGALVKQMIQSTGRGEVLAHEYQLLLRL